MENKKRIQQILNYLFQPEDSSEDITMGEFGTSYRLSSFSPTWLGAIKTMLWAVVAIVVPLVFITLSS